MTTRYLLTAICHDRRGIQRSKGINSYTKTHPLQKHFASLVGEQHKEFLHAELAALIRYDIESYGEIDTLLITRYNNKGELRNAKPCAICQAAIKAFGVKRVIYSTDKGTMDELEKTNP